MSIATKLTTIANIKEAIRQAIVGKGVACPTTEPFANYAAKIAAISGGNTEIVSVAISGVGSVFSEFYSGQYTLVKGTGLNRIYVMINASNYTLCLFYQPPYNRWAIYEQHDTTILAPMIYSDSNSVADPWSATWHVRDESGATVTVTKVE